MLMHFQFPEVCHDFFMWAHKSGLSLPPSGSPHFPTSKNSNTLKKYIYSKKLDCFLCLCLNNIVWTMWLRCSYSGRLHYHSSYWTDHTNTFQRKIMISVNFCWQAFSATLLSPGSLPAAEPGFSTTPKYKIMKAALPCESCWRGNPCIYRVPIMQLRGLKNTQHQPRCFLLYTGSRK